MALKKSALQRYNAAERNCGTYNAARIGRAPTRHPRLPTPCLHHPSTHTPLVVDQHQRRLDQVRQRAPLLLVEESLEQRCVTPLPVIGSARLHLDGKTSDFDKILIKI